MKVTMPYHNEFWNSAWTSDKSTKNTEMIGLLIPRSALEFSYKMLGNIEGKKLLEVGCGSGMQTIEFCKKRAYVTAIDISEESIKAVKRLSRKYNVKNLEIKKMSAESLKFPDNYFDCAYINCTLMHMDKEKVFKECLRVLKPNGLLVFKETLKHWLFAFPYRFLSPYRKTKPSYITLSDVKKLKAAHKEFYLFSTFFLFLFYIFKNKKIPYKLFNALSKIDECLLKALPPLRNISWVTVAYLEKK